MGNNGKRQYRGKVATIGTFDGLHRGHRGVLSTVKSEAAKRGLEPAVISFDRHPLETIAPERAPRLIQNPGERTAMLLKEGLHPINLEFTREFASMTALQLLRKIHEEEGVEVLVVGYDNTFGCDGTSMNISDYRRLGKETGVEIIEAPYEPKAASSAIRRLLSEGRIEEANGILGRPFRITGTVVDGKKMGRKIGFPTANILPAYRALIPRNGIYVADVVMPDAQIMRGVVNIGRQPTMASEAPLRMEVHIPDFSGDLYSRNLSVEFLTRLRDEKKFDSAEELTYQIKEDVRKSLEWGMESGAPA